MPEYIPRRDVTDFLKNSTKPELRTLAGRIEQGDPRVIEDYEFWAQKYDEFVEAKQRARERFAR